ncbi:Flp pilus assembly complex ATPase component [Puniceicoccales bacterium CK1056]|uniref:Flp pilus assembly complex ATPase component n=1 Tax=Oceanipulchritudo coccoides TaxID=2706888 RepID=A0A6B2M091_9BACT|nr:ATPase, T2SS/T4P/T4SS family [Oceanipulchritudo coccoides]NDV62123.1 Flp pilus assembly complex ATPase component [Oceanipulchritudo coccoides]
MPSYRPFLTPLLPKSLSGVAQARREPPKSPLEEEALLGGFQGQEERIWTLLEQKVKESFGISLLLDLPEKCRVVSCPGMIRQRTPNRFLVLQTPHTNWFLIEQPASIPLIDMYSVEDQRAAIARPTLFARLWREMENVGEPEVAPDLQVEESSEKTARALEKYITALVQMGDPSDWHLEPGQDGFRSRLRIDGRLQLDEFIPAAKGRWLINSLVSVIGLNPAAGIASEGQLLHRLPSGKEIPLRVSMIPSQHGPAVVMRFLYPLEKRKMHLEILGLPPEDTEVLTHRYQAGRGLWLVVGPTGSGKSTTLRAFLQLSIKAQEKVLAVEDPVEFPLPGAHHLSVGAPPGLTWTRALRAFLRQAPDSVLIGEIRDEETATIALQAARTGHRILSTLHARDNPGVKRRLCDLGQPSDSLDSVCECILHQRLLPRLCPHCRSLAPVSQAASAEIRRAGLPVPATLASGKGCTHCHSGVKGRMPIFSSGDFSPRSETRIELQRSAWNAVFRHEVSLNDALPHLSEPLRSRFGICQP